MKLKSLAYRALKYSNDASAVRRGRVGARVGRRVVGRPVGLAFWKLFGGGK